MEGTQKIVTPRPAATVILIRDGHSGLEVLLGEKTSKVNFAAGAFVFPGGAVDADDRRENFLLKSALTDSEAAQHLGLSEGAINYWIAAIRECFEEVGILYANYSEDSKKSQNDLAMFRSEKRDELARGEINFHQALKEENLQLEIDKLQYFSRWVTHAGSPRRYDTRFFIARMPEGQSAQHDGGELVDHRWLTPNEALKLSGEGKLNLMFPTQKTIEKLAEFSEVEGALNYARSNLPVTPMTPRVSIGSEGNKLLLPGDYAYAEAGKLDPRQLGTVSYEIKAGEPVQLDRRVIRLTAPNPSVMTGPGTNTYIIGDHVEGFVVIDPGPRDQSHIDLIKDLTSSQIKSIFCTHTHADHSPGAQLLSSQLGVSVIGRLPTYSDRQDQSFQPEKQPNNGDKLNLGALSFSVVHTPGHASNHLCFLFHEASMLFTGDHIMQGSTVVINPPDGDMTDYFDSLHRLYDHQFDWIAPGHGFLMDNPHEVIDRLLIHRQKREMKIFNALLSSGEGTLDDLVVHAYDDVDEQLYPLAKRSLLAHLIKLLKEGRVSESGENWKVVSK